MSAISQQAVPLSPSYPRSTLFQFGPVSITPAAAELIRMCRQCVDQYLSRHAAGGWTEMDIEEAVSNTEAIANGQRVVSAYQACAGLRLFVVTNSDRSATTVQLTSE